MLIEWIVHLNSYSENVFETPFDFFQKFGTYWEEKGWSRIGHQLEDLFTRLYAYLLNSENISLPTIKSVMKIDYLSKLKFQPRKPWWENDLTKDEQASVYKQLINEPELAGEEFLAFNLNEKELFKQTFITPISICFNSYQQGIILEKEGYLVTTFSKLSTPHFSYIEKSGSAYHCPTVNGDIARRQLLRQRRLPIDRAHISTSIRENPSKQVL